MLCSKPFGEQLGDHFIEHVIQKDFKNRAESNKFHTQASTQYRAGHGSLFQRLTRREGIIYRCPRPCGREFDNIYSINNHGHHKHRNPETGL